MPRKQVIRIIIGILAIMTLTLILGSIAWAKEYKTLHKFKQTGIRGRFPYGGLTIDAAGNLYGTTWDGGAFGWGTVFKLTPKQNGRWVESVLHSFNRSDGAYPYAGLTFDAAGNLYGATSSGGTHDGGTVFELTPNGDGSWVESVLHSFNGSDGEDCLGGLIFDAAGNLYGTTFAGGTFQAGTVFELTPNGDGSWGESVLHSFNVSDGADPAAGLIFDAAGNLYGTTFIGGRGPCGSQGCGTVFRLAPNGDGSWTESILHSFNVSDGANPRSSLTFDAAGNLYGITSIGGSGSACGRYGCGTVFQLTPQAGGGWVESVLHAFNGSDGAYPNSSLIFDAAGNLYGTAVVGGGGACINGSFTGCGTVFKLRPTLAGAWRYRVLHEFQDHPGAWPYSGLVPDQAGNLYGTTVGDGTITSGTTTFGSVYEFTP